MSDPSLHPESIRILKKATTNAEELFRQKCPMEVCKLAGVVLIPGESTQRVAGSEMIWFEDMTHGVMCNADCSFVGKPMEVTSVFTEAIQKTIEDLGIIAAVDSPTRRDSPDFN